jgi:hypothetical protein
VEEAAPATSSSSSTCKVKPPPRAGPVAPPMARPKPLQAPGVYGQFASGSSSTAEDLSVARSAALPELFRAMVSTAERRQTVANSH